MKIILILCCIATASSGLNLEGIKGTYDETLEKILDKMYPEPLSRVAPDAGERVILTPLIKGNRLKEARELAAVSTDHLNYEIESYAGYLTVDKKYNSNLWFWYFPVQDKPVEKTPWIIWLQGGPGASSLFGLFEEMGPFFVNEDFELQKRKYAWSGNYSLLFFDNPVGTGFSFTEDDRGFATNQTTIRKHLYNALQQFLAVFPELRAAPMFISGESYAGKHIPSLAFEIHENKDVDDRKINMQGLMIGNGFIDPYSLQNYAGMMKETGHIDDETSKKIKDLETKVQESLDNGNSRQAFNYYGKLLNLFMYSSQLNSIYNYLYDDFELDTRYTGLIQTSEMRMALHVGNTNFTSIGKVYRMLIPDFMNSAKGMLEELIPHYRIMSFCGHLDVIVAYGALENTYANLTINNEKPYRSTKRQVWFHNGRAAGYFKEIGKFTEVMVRKAGHMVPTDAPSAALGLISAFIEGSPLSTDTGVFVPSDEDYDKVKNCRRG